MAIHVSGGEANKEKIKTLIQKDSSLLQTTLVSQLPKHHADYKVYQCKTAKGIQWERFTRITEAEKQLLSLR